MKIPKTFRPDKNFEKKIEELKNYTKTKKSEPKFNRYEINPPEKTYALSLHSLRNSASILSHPSITHNGETLIRPLTFKETLEVIINDFETKTNHDGLERSMEERFALFERGFCTCTGMVSRPDEKRIKIIPMAIPLILLDRNHDYAYTPICYKSVQGIELRIKGGYEYNLTKKKFLKHKGMLALVERDKHLLKTYANIIYSPEKGKSINEKEMMFTFRVNGRYDSEPNGQLHPVYRSSWGSYPISGIHTYVGPTQMYKGSRFLKLNNNYTTCS